MPGAALYKNPQNISIEWWPSLQDYNEAIQNPKACLNDLELKNSLPYTTALGLPRAITGSFASVYRMHCADKDYALRLFLKNIKDQAERYARISSFVQNDNLPYTVTFDFLTNGIKSRGEWLPALKMEWVEGQQFDDYIVGNLKNADKLGLLASNFMKMMEEMRAAGIAHGDLQHGNIIICNDELRLVDYDGMYVPAMRNFASNELGHPNYQHPSRDQNHFGPYLDNFSAWIIYASIKALQFDPALLNQLGGCDDSLLFRRSDFQDPLRSAAFAAFEKHENEELRKLGSFVRAQLSKDVTRIPYLQEEIENDQMINLTPIAEEVSAVKEGPRLIRNEEKTWLDEKHVSALPNDHQIRLFTDPDYKDNKTSWTVQAPATQQAIWVKPTIDDFKSRHLTGDLRVDASGALVLPLELSDATIPRWTLFNKHLGPSPENVQWLMLLNPAVWYMIFSFTVAMTVDNNLRVNGQTYNATVTSVNRYETRNKSYVDQNTDVTLLYRVDGKPYTISRNLGQDWGRYRQGDVYPVRALPSDPKVQEPFGDAAGTQQWTDLWHGFICLIINCTAEALIWMRPLWHKRLARKGFATFATLESIWDADSAGHSSYGAKVSYVLGSKNYETTIRLNQSQFQRLQQGTREIILCDPDFPDLFVFYKFCCYHAVYVPPAARHFP
jgi:serine/threonine protein kinase